MKKAENVCLILGSNLGSREQYLNVALKELNENGVKVCKKTHFLETEPEEVDAEEHPSYLNVGVISQTELGPFELLKLTEEVERKLGRTGKGLKKPRTIDIDIIFYGEKVIRAPELQIPHPGAVKREFMLKIIKMLCPGYVHPLFGKPVQEITLPQKNPDV